jgi:hypothetical protein
MHLTHFIVYTLTIGPNGAALDVRGTWCGPVLKPKLAFRDNKIHTSSNRLSFYALHPREN